MITTKFVYNSYFQITKRKSIAENIENCWPSDVQFIDWEVEEIIPMDESSLQEQQKTIHNGLI